MDKDSSYSWSFAHQTLYRCLSEYGIDTGTYTNVTESELNEQIKDEHTNFRKVMLKSHLLHMDVKVPRAKLRSAIQSFQYCVTV